MLRSRVLINTPLQRGACAQAGTPNRFSGFDPAAELQAALKTAEAVKISTVGPTTPLKRGVNESELRHVSYSFNPFNVLTIQRFNVLTPFGYGSVLRCE